MSESSKPTDAMAPTSTEQNVGSCTAEMDQRNGNVRFEHQRCHRCEWVGDPDYPQICPMCYAKNCLSIVLEKKTCNACRWHGHPEYVQECPACGEVNVLR